jgi:DDE superfamily endonuclease
VLGFADEVWWSRLAQPNLATWTLEKALPLLSKEVAKDDPDRKAIACYGLLRSDTEQMLLRFVEGRPVSQVTCDYLAWVTQKLAAEGKKALLLVWDNASWHISKIVQGWLQAHNRHVKRVGGVRIVECALPVKSPWLNRIEPKWVHGKRAIAEPERTLSASELMERICAYYGCEHQEPLAQKVD